MVLPLSAFGPLLQLSPTSLPMRLGHDARPTRAEAGASRRSVPHAEYAEYLPYGGFEIARRQLEELAEQSEQQSIEVQVVPTHVDGFPGAGHTLLFLL
ncbi:Scr1 family TA system antitoxin-like transcriptional regulator [Streptomyces sp. NPDC058812]|uniref:Scr1 family TA system antitoxin-like transcriptional regulator n=1 Tax=unclassified Streptomyces TaxID=2593676 RepID=UPI00368A933C